MSWVRADATWTVLFFPFRERQVDVRDANLHYQNLHNQLRSLAHPIQKVKISPTNNQAILMNSDIPNFACIGLSSRNGALLRPHISGLRQFWETGVHRQSVQFTFEEVAQSS